MTASYPEMLIARGQAGAARIVRMRGLVPGALASCEFGIAAEERRAAGRLIAGKHEPFTRALPCVVNPCPSA